MLLKRLIDLHVDSNLVLWIRDFLRDRPQRVCMNGYLSEEVVLNAGAPQGCVLPPMLFSINTNHMNLQTAITCLFKFVDNMTLVGLLLNEDSLATYFSHISLLNEWCEESFLEINVGKTKALVLDARKTKIFVPVKVNNEPVKVVSNFKYLDTLIDNKPSFSDNSDLIYKKKSQQRLYLLRKLRSFDVSRELLQIVYKSLVEAF